jgi:hypothetical protein
MTTTTNDAKVLSPRFRYVPAGIVAATAAAAVGANGAAATAAAAVAGPSTGRSYLVSLEDGVERWYPINSCDDKDAESQTLFTMTTDLIAVHWTEIQECGINMRHLTQEVLDHARARCVADIKVFVNSPNVYLMARKLLGDESGVTAFLRGLGLRNEPVTTSIQSRGRASISFVERWALAELEDEQGPEAAAAARKYLDEIQPVEGPSLYEVHKNRLNAKIEEAKKSGFDFYKSDSDSDSSDSDSDVQSDDKNLKKKKTAAPAAATEDILYSDHDGDSDDEYEDLVRISPPPLKRQKIDALADGGDSKASPAAVAVPPSTPAPSPVATKKTTTTKRPKAKAAAAATSGKRKASDAFGDMIDDLLGAYGL